MLLKKQEKGFILSNSFQYHKDWKEMKTWYINNWVVFLWDKGYEKLEKSLIEQQETSLCGRSQKLKKFRAFASDFASDFASVTM